MGIREKDRYALFCKMINILDEGFSYIAEYDSLLHDYNGVILFQAESQIIKAVGNKPGITASELSRIFNKTKSACSQLIRKLKKKGWIRQEINETNNREYKLYLTDEGKVIYVNHQQFEKSCYARTFQMLNEFSEEDMSIYIKVQQQLNKAFEMDVAESKHRLTALSFVTESQHETS